MPAPMPLSTPAPAADTMHGAAPLASKLCSPLLSSLLALAAGALSVLAFAPFGLWPLQIATLAVLFGLAAHTLSVKQGALLGWLYGFACAACGVHWLYVSMHQFGGMPAAMAVLAVLLLAAYVGAWSALALAAALWLQRRWNKPCRDPAALAAAGLLGRLGMAARLGLDRLSVAGGRLCP